MTQQAFVNLRITELTEKLLVEALGRRALAGGPIPVDELIQEWAAGDQNPEVRRAKLLTAMDSAPIRLMEKLTTAEEAYASGVVDDPRKAVLDAILKPEPSAEKWDSAESEAVLDATLSLAVTKAHAVLDQLEEGEFTEPPAYRSGRAMPERQQGWEDVGATAPTTAWNRWAANIPPWHLSLREPDYPSDTRVDQGPAVEEYTKPALVMPVSEEALANAAEDREVGLDDPAPALALHSEPEDAELLASEDLTRQESGTASEAPKRRRRTKNEMTLARDEVTNAYRAAVGDSPWSKGWTIAHEAGLAAADEAGRRLLLTPYQTRQAVAGAVESARAEFDEPTTTAPEPTDPDGFLFDPQGARTDATEHGPDDAGVQRVEDIVTNEQPPKYAVFGGDPAPTLEEAPRLTGSVELGSFKTLPPEPGTPTDDEIFSQFLNK